VVTEINLTLAGGRTLRAYDTGGEGDDRLAVFWHHGTPNIGEPPAPLFPVADRLGIRFLGHDRPGYGGSPRRPGRDVASAAADMAGIADALGIGRFAVIGHSGGAPHALACGALLGDRVLAVAGMAGLAPYGADGLDYFADMADSGVAALRTAAQGREAKERYEASGAQYDPEFTDADLATLSGAWSWLGRIVGAAVDSDTGGAVDDDLAYVAPWGFDPAGIGVPVLLVHGGRDRVVPAAHSRWLAGRIPSAELRLSPDDGHVSLLNSAPDALEWLRERAG
jgi:pimeloyl-ACP methyl ester carboxylesterase